MGAKRKFVVKYHLPGQPPKSSSKTVQAESESDAADVFRRTSDSRAIVDVVLPG